MSDRYFTVKQVADRLGVSPSVIRRRDAALQPLRLGGRDRRYTEAHVALASRLLFGERATAAVAHRGTGDGSDQEAMGRLEAWRADSAMAWIAAELSGEPLPPNARIVPTFEQEEGQTFEGALPSLRDGPVPVAMAPGSLKTFKRAMEQAAERR